MDRGAMFRTLHQPGRTVPLLLPVAHDLRSACLYESAGAEAVAITSAGLVRAHGLRNGGRPTPAVFGAAVAAIVRGVAIPVTVDFDIAAAADLRWLDETVAAAIAAGAAGIDLADGDAPVAALCARISAARTAAEDAGADVFVNARTDVYLRGLMPIERSIQETIDRARRYRDAGCDAVSAPGVADVHHIRSIASATQMPLNVLAHPLLPALETLSALGVRRVTSAVSAVTTETAGTASHGGRVHAALFRAGRTVAA